MLKKNSVWCQVSLLRPSVYLRHVDSTNYSFEQSVKLRGRKMSISVSQFFLYFWLLFGNWQLIKTWNLKTVFSTKSQQETKFFRFWIYCKFLIYCARIHKISRIFEHTVAFSSHDEHHEVSEQRHWLKNLKPPSPSHWMQFRCLSSELVKYHGKFRLTCL